MKLHRYVAPLRQCDYLPEQKSRMVYAEVGELSPQEYLDLINQRWRRFGYWLFRPECPSCNACQPIRVPVQDFKPNRAQRRLFKSNSSSIRLIISPPKIDDARINLYVAHHKHHAETRAWRQSSDDSALSSIMSFTVSPLPVQEWAYYLGDQLVAIAYVDQLPDGFSGIYFYHSPEHRHLSLGNWICLTMIEKAQELGYPYIYFGYYIKGNISMEYKAAFKPNQILDSEGQWQLFKE
ncbi:MAG: arginyltransferase [Candidatus Obscuribacterales bacterium]|nr:arginyltransferase [Candidatus Obscuribacterales bacterium]